MKCLKHLIIVYSLMMILCSDTVTLFRDGMGLSNTELKNLNLDDDNFDDDDPEIIIHLRLMACYN